MADETHVRLVQAGVRDLEIFRQSSPEIPLDLSNAVLENIRFEGGDLSKSNLSGARLSGAIFTRTRFDDADLSFADAINANFVEAKFQRANLTSARLIGSQMNQADLQFVDLRNADFSNANLGSATIAGASTNGTNFSGVIFVHATIGTDQISAAVVRGAHLQNMDLSRAKLSKHDLSGTIFNTSNLTEADFTDANLDGAQFAGAVLRGAVFNNATAINASFSSSDMTGAKLVGAELIRADFNHAIADGADITSANFFEANMQSVSMRGVKGAFRAKNLQTTRPAEENNIRYFDTVVRDWPERWIDWERIRIAGRLPLFGASYTGLIVIPLYIYFLGLYNDKVIGVRAWIESTMVDKNGQPSQLSAVILDHLRSEPIPTKFQLLFASALFLALAATIYAVCCPPRIKTFSRDQWCDELRRPLIHYWTYAWKGRALRLLCAFLYIVGGLGAVAVLASKLWFVFEVLFGLSPPP